MYRKFFMLSIAFGCISLSIGCSSSVPSEETGRQVFVNTKTYARLEKFRKTNATENEVLGQKFYTMEYSADVTYLNDIKTRVGNALEFTVRNKAGDKGTETGKLEFQKTEKGWRGEDGNVY
jgi:hypothetical protein